MTDQTQEVLLGCDPQVRVVVSEDEGNLFIRVYAENEEVTDIDALLFNLNDDAKAGDLTIYPDVDVKEITDFTVSPGSMNQINNGAQTKDAYDVRVEFGQEPYGTLGDTDTAAFTLYMDSDQPLSLADIDFGNMTAIINSDGGNGLALTNNGGNGADATYETVVTKVMSEDFENIWAPKQSANIDSDDNWAIKNGQAFTNGCKDGTLEFGEVKACAPVALSLDMRAEGLCNFEQDGCYADSLRLEVQIDGGDWVLLDEFRINDDNTAMVGSETGQCFTGDMTNICYSGGVLDGAQDSVQFRMVSDISAANEQIYIDNVEILTTEDVLVEDEPETTLVDVVGMDEDFEGICDPAQSDNIVSDGNWAIRGGEAMTNGCKDGELLFDKVETACKAAISLDMRAEGLRNFENCGWGTDKVSLEVQIDGGDWQLLDTFMINDAKTALVGCETGQSFGCDATTLTYSGGVLDEATESVQFRIVSDITAWNEKVYVDNVEIMTTEEVAVEDDTQPITEDFEGASAGDTADTQFENFTVSAQRAGDDDASENDAMIFDTNNPTGGDWDLSYTDQGNALIISEDNDECDPDDNACGGTISFEFTTPAAVLSLNVLDVEETGGAIDLYDVNGGLIKSVEIPAAGNNSAQTIDIDARGVAAMDVHLVGSGAVDDLTYIPEAGGDDCETGDDCDQYAVTYDDWVAPTATPEEEDDIQLPWQEEEEEDELADIQFI
ncbi:hypothetical protein [Pseudoprimorskyibacter insulae]|uniref:Uncharacterized protein n=1 Tax=Pseudoprimorskyibacter insulae TaxID=1695997 RepID=A0A2R8AXI0_9RHOB|nr:hypothetical protein [Pseudoprimorskyibacter insulae]SPF80736.1 hypothetical protein PRI8871_02547 [Pseudoprimorskyibacter insulae]